jgi:hypothetical protein
LQPYSDPGWGPAFGRMLPGLGGRTEATSGLILMRALFLTLLTAAYLILFVTAFVLERVGSPDPLLAAVVVVLGLVGAGAAKTTSNRPLAGKDASDVAAAYRTGFFLGFALNQIPLLIAFALCFVEDALWPYLVALPLFSIGMAVIAPSRRNLDKREDQLRRYGSTVSLRNALDQPPSPTAD